MDREDFIITVFYFIDNFFEALTKGKKVRQRGPRPALLDTEVITMQIVGEFLGMDGDKNIWEYFSRNWICLFPRIGERTAFVKQAGNLLYWTQRLQEKIAGELGAMSDILYTTDGFPIPVVHFKRAHFSNAASCKIEYQRRSLRPLFKLDERRAEARRNRHWTTHRTIPYRKNKIQERFQNVAAVNPKDIGPHHGTFCQSYFGKAYIAA